jgi:hypothetical protein
VKPCISTWTSSNVDQNSFQKVSARDDRNRHP